MSLILDGTSNAITFPDTTVQSTSALVAGKVPYSTLPAGSVLQVVQGSTTTQTTTTSSTYVAATNMTASITPKYSTSKILVLVSTQMTPGGSGRQPFAAIARNGSVISEGAANYNAAGNDIWSSVCMNYLDSPSTTSSTAYAVYFKIAYGTGGVTIGWGSPVVTTITLLEIAA